MLDAELAHSLHELAREQGRKEEDVLAELARSGREQASRNDELEARWNSLTLREREVLALACMGRRNSEIAALLGVTQQTVKSHWQNIFHKFGLRSTRELRLALQGWRLEEWWETRHR